MKDVPICANCGQPLVGVIRWTRTPGSWSGEEFALGAEGLRHAGYWTRGKERPERHEWRCLRCKGSVGRSAANQLTRLHKSG